MADPDVEVFLCLVKAKTKKNKKKKQKTNKNSNVFFFTGDSLISSEDSTPIEYIASDLKDLRHALGYIASRSTRILITLLGKHHCQYTAGKFVILIFLFPLGVLNL